MENSLFFLDAARKPEENNYIECPQEEWGGWGGTVAQTDVHVSAAETLMV